MAHHREESQDPRFQSCRQELQRKLIEARTLQQNARTPYFKACEEGRVAGFAEALLVLEKYWGEQHDFTPTRTGD
jgi:hypothetical protein